MISRLRDRVTELRLKSTVCTDLSKGNRVLIQTEDGYGALGNGNGSNSSCAVIMVISSYLRIFDDGLFQFITDTHLLTASVKNLCRL